VKSLRESKNKGKIIKQRYVTKSCSKKMYITLLKKKVII